MIPFFYNLCHVVKSTKEPKEPKEQKVAAKNIPNRCLCSAPLEGRRNDANKYNEVLNGQFFDFLSLGNSRMLRFAKTRKIE